MRSYGVGDFLKARIGEKAYAQWFSTMKIEERGSNTIVVSFPFKFITSGVRLQYYDDLQAYVRGVYGTRKHVVVLHRP